MRAGYPARHRPGGTGHWAPHDVGNPPQSVRAPRSWPPAPGPPPPPPLPPPAKTVTKSPWQSGSRCPSTRTQPGDKQEVQGTSDTTGRTVRRQGRCCCSQGAGRHTHTNTHAQALSARPHTALMLTRDTPEGTDVGTAVTATTGHFSKGASSRRQDSYGHRLELRATDTGRRGGGGGARTGEQLVLASGFGAQSSSHSKLTGLRGAGW